MLADARAGMGHARDVAALLVMPPFMEDGFVTMVRYSTHPRWPLRSGCAGGSADHRDRGPPSPGLDAKLPLGHKRTAPTPQLPMLADVIGVEPYPGAPARHVMRLRHGRPHTWRFCLLLCMLRHVKKVSQRPYRGTQFDTRKQWVIL